MEVNVNLIIIALLFIALDVITGLFQAVVNKTISSAKMREGLLHKCGFVFAIIFGYMCEFATTIVELGFPCPLGSGVCAFIVLTEIASILENLKMINPELANAKFLRLFNSEDKQQ